MEVLWDDEGNDLNVHPVRALGADDIRELLRTRHLIPFVTTTRRLKWIRGDARFAFWKNELLPHLREPDDPRRYREEFLDEWWYEATEWRREDGAAEAPFCIVCELWE